MSLASSRYSLFTIVLKANISADPVSSVIACMKASVCRFYAFFTDADM